MITALTWIEAPENCLALPLVLDGVRNLQAAFQRVAAANTPALDTVVAPLAEIANSVRIVQSLLAEHGRSQLRQIKRPAKDRLLPFRGVMSSHPIYTLLGSWHWRVNAAVLDEITLDAVATIILFAKARAHSLAGSTAGLTPIYDACTKFRDLLHEHPQTLRDRLQARDWIHRAPSSELEPAFDAVRRVIEPVLREHGLLDGIQQDEEETTGETVTGRPRDERLDRGDVLHLQTITRLHSTTRLALERSGLIMGEFEPQEEFIEWTEFGEEDPLDPTPPPPIERSLAEQVLRTKGMISRRERAMQLLAADWTRPTNAEVVRLWHALQAWSTHTDVQSREAAALLALALWTSHPYQAGPDGGLCAMKVVTHAEDAPQTPSSRPLLLLDHWALRLPVLRPAEQPEYRGVDRRLARPCVDAVDIPLPSALHPLIDTLPAVQDLHANRRKRPVDAFTVPAADLFEITADLLRNHVVDSAGRLTLPAVGQWMFRRLVERRRDHALASLATGRPHLLADTGLHYLHVDAIDLARWVAEEQVHAWTDLQRIDQSLGGNASAATLPRPDSAPPQLGIGSPIVPCDDTVQSLADKLATQLTHARGQPLANDALITLHNALTQYVHALLRFSLGLRDVGQPLPDWNRFDLHHGVVLLSDKDDVAASATRLVPLCPTAAKQLQVYARHARAMLTRCIPEDLASAPPVLFYLRRGRNDDIKRIARPTRDIAAAFEKTTGYTLPRNTGRHWLRSRLAQLGISGEHIEFFMGHWQRGAEPWGRFSTLSAQTAIDGLRDPIEQLVQDAGFRVVRGWA